MEDVHEGQWICHLADALACEIIKEMAEIPLKRMDTRVHDRMLDVVHGNIDGEYPMKLLFRAEPRLFGRIAENMIGEQPEDEEETREYAREFFNVLCGRFVSELHRITPLVGRFHPVEYEACPTDCDRKHGPFCTIYFMSDKDEYAEFSWSKSAMEELLRRSGKQ